MMAKISWSAALADYLRDETMSYRILADKFGVSKQAVVARAKKERWQELRTETRSKVNQKLTEIVSEDIAEVRKKHAGYGRKLWEMGAEALESGKVSINTAREAVQSIKEGINIERTALGMNKDDSLPTEGPKIIIDTQEWANALRSSYGIKTDGMIDRK